MPENVEKNTQQAGVSVRVPQWVLDEVEEQIKKHPRPRPTRGELLEQAWRTFAAASGSSPTIVSAAPIPEVNPPKGQEKALTRDIISGVPDEMVNVLRRHAADSRFRDSVLALGEIWDASDEEYIDSIARNCKAFARASRVVGGLQVDTGRGAEEHPKERMDRAVERARKTREGHGEG